MVSLFSLPDPEVLSDSRNTVYLCDPLDRCECLAVLPITAIKCVVAMFPELKVAQDGHITETGKLSLMRHPYIGISQGDSDMFLEDDDDDDIST
jgi:hypothetical protein